MIFHPTWTLALQLCIHHDISDIGSFSNSLLNVTIWVGRALDNSMLIHLAIHTPLKINMEHNHGGLEDDFPL